MTNTAARVVAGFAACFARIPTLRYLLPLVAFFIGQNAVAVALPPSTLTAVAPTSMHYGATLVLTGSGFTTGATSPTVTVASTVNGGTSATYTVTPDSDTQITFKLGSLPSGTYTITVTVNTATGARASSPFSPFTVEAPAWSLQNPKPVASFLENVTYGAGLYVATSTSYPGLILTSTDASTWTVTYNSIAGLRAVTFANKLFVAAGDSGQIITSADGMTWTVQMSGTTQPLYGVAYGAGKFVVLGWNSTVLTSTDGVTWAMGSLGTTGITFNGAAYAANVFVGVGNAGKIFTSADAVTWTSQNSNTASQLNEVIYGGNKFLAVGQGVITTSTDGVAWTVQTLPTGFTNASFVAAAYGGGRYDVASFGSMLTSLDGVSWTTVSGLNVDIRGLTYANNQFVGVGFPGQVFTSNDGLSFTLRTGVTRRYLFDGVYGNGRYIVVGTNGTIAVSTDLQNWNVRETVNGNSATLRRAAYGGGMYVVAGSGGTILNSTDAASWSSKSNSSSQPINGLTYGGGQFVTVGNAGTISTSPDGLIWTLGSLGSGLTTNLNGVDYGAGKYVAVGALGAIYTSTNGSTWTPASSGVATDLYSVCYGNGEFLAVGTGSVVLTSTDGVTWTKQAVAPTNLPLSDVVAAEGLFIAVNTPDATGGSTGNILVSADGVNWSQFTVGTSILNQNGNIAQTGIGYGNGRFFIVTGSGEIVTSQPLSDSLRILTQPSSQTIKSGDVVTLMVTASAGTSTQSPPSFAYQWYRGASGDTSTPVGTNSAAYTTDALTGSARFWVRVSTVGTGRSVDSAEADLFGPPSIVQQPTSQPATDATFAGLTVQTLGNGPFNYQWKFNGAAIPGAVRQNYQLPYGPTAAGSYTVDVSNALGSTTSAPAIVTYTPSAPTIQNQPMSESTLANSGVDFSVTATGTGPFTYQWQLNGKNLANTPDQVDGANGPDLSVKHPQLTDAGSYTCVVSNSLGSVTSAAATLSVTDGPPTIVSQPGASSQINEGSAVELSLSATGTGPLQYQWKFNGTDIPGATTDTYDMAAITAAQAGTYTCVVSNPNAPANYVGTATSTAVTIAVTPVAPGINTAPGQMLAVYGTPTMTSVNVTGTAPISYQWKKGGVAIPGATSPDLVIPSADASAVATYTVDISNAVGTTSTSAMPAQLAIVNPSVVKSVLPAPHDTPLNGVAYGAGKFVAVGSAGSIRTSTDGVTWTELPAPGNFSLNSITRANDLFVAVGSVQVFGTVESTGVLLTSMDGMTWTRQSLGDYVPTLYRVDYLGGKFIAVGDYGEILTSTDGLSWTARTSGTATTLEGVAYGNGKYLVSGYKIVLSSTDGVNWSPVTTLPGEADFSNIAFGNGVFLITVSDGGAAYSADGVTWSIAGGNIDGDAVNRAIYANGTWLAVSNLGNVYTSKDAAVWTGFPVGAAAPLQDVIYANHTFVAVGQSAEVMTSADGLAWASHRNSPLPAVSFRGVASSASSYVLVGDSGVLASSTDGWNWTLRTAPNLALYGVTYGGGQFVAVGQSGVVLRSTDGNFWSSVGVPGFSGILRAVTYDGTNYIAVGDSGRIFTSPDAAVWTQQNANTTNSLRTVVASNGTIVVGGTGGTVLTASSSAPTSWILRKANTSTTLVSSAAGGGVFVVAGFDGLRSNVLTSTDGIAWSLAILPYSSSINGLVYANGRFSTASGSSAILSSADGVTWTPEFSGTTNRQVAITYGPAGYISVGDAGSVITFAATPAPTVTQVKSSTPYSGSTLTITGANFTGATSVTVNGVAIPNFTVDSDTQITATLPLTASAGPVTVTTTAGSNIAAPTGQLQITTVVAPTIAKQPVDMVASIGDPVTFTITASGVPDPTYQWAKDGSPIKGATDASYTITAAATADSGGYACTVTNVAGTVTSATATLGLKPAITAQPVAVTVLEGGQTSLSVTADGTGPLTYQWYKGDFLVRGATTATLNFAQVSLDAGGVYSVTVTNAYGSVGSNGVTLTITPLPTAPSIAKQPASVTANFGSTATFAVEAAGTSPLTYVWKHGTTVLSANSGTLTLTGVTVADAGDYTVTVSNSLGSVTSNSASLSVNVPPAITSAPTSLTVTAGAAATFSVKASGTAPLTYAWTRNGKPIDGANTATYAIGQTATTDTGTYTCTVANMAGVATASASLTVNPAVIPPTITSATSAAIAVNTPFSYTIVATNTPTSYGASPLPAGLALSGNVISGTPTAAGTTAVRLTATNAGGTGDATLALAVIQPVPVVTSGSHTNGRVGDVFSYAITATNTPTSFALVGDARLPAGLQLNTGTGTIAGTPTVAGTFVVNVAAANAAGASPSFAITITIAQSVAASVITSSPTATGRVGVAFSYQLTASNAPTSYTVSELPSGLTIDNSGLISGTPKAAGTYTISAFATNSAGAGPAISIVLAIAPAASAPAITSSTSATATAGTQFFYAIAATNNPTSFGASTPLPDGLTFAQNVISGVPTTAGDTVVVISATNADGTGTAKLTIHVVPGLSAPAISSSPTAAGKVGVAFSYATIASNAPTGFAASNLPTGLTINSDTGVITGTPSAAGTFTVTLTASNAAGTGAPFTVIIKIESAATAPVITSAATATITAKTLFSYQITATNTPTSFAANNLPDGLAVNQLTGVITGTTTSTGLFNVVLTASNSVGTSTPLTLLLNVQAPALAPTVTSSQTASAVQGAAFSYQITASNMPAAAGSPMPAGTGFAAMGLPDGLAVNPATGAISGSPTLTGSFVVTLTAFNDAGTSAGKALTLTVAASPTAPKIDSADTAGATAGTAFSYQIHASNSPTSYDAAGRPAWLSIDTSAGWLSGVPDMPGVYKVALTAANSVGTSGAFLLTITVAAADGSPVIRSALTITSQANNAFAYQIDASNGPIKAYYAVGLPGLGLDPATGAVSGIPTVPGTYNVQIYASNAIGIGAAKTLVITITPAPGSPVIGAGPTGQSTLHARSLADGGSAAAGAGEIDSTATVGVPYTFQIAASGTPTNFTADGLPTGLALNPATGLISGAPAVAGVFNVAISASNTIGVGASATLVLTVSPPPTAPTVNSAATASGTVGTAFSYTATATNSPTSYNAAGLPNGLALNATTGAITGTPTTAGTFAAKLSANNNVGTGPDTSVTITISAAAGAPAITSAASASGVVGVTFGYQITASNTPTGYTASGLPPGLSLNTATGAIAGTPVANGTYSAMLTATNAAGTSAPFTLVITVAPPATTPAIISSLSATATAGTTFAYQISATNTPGTYNVTGLPAGLSADTTSGLIEGAPTTAGTYAIMLSANNDAGTGATVTLTLTVQPATGTPGTPTGVSGAHLINVSARANAGTGDNVLIAGFVISGSTPKPVLIRAVGPTLAGQGVRSVLADPKVDLYRLSTKIGTNDNWASGDATTIAATAARVGAFALPSGSNDAVIQTTLDPGIYTAIASGVNSTTGVTLVEVYDTGDTQTTTTPRLVNIAARGNVGTGENVLIAGFVVSGDQSRQYLIRAMGPGLTPLGVSGALANPKLQVYKDGAVIKENDDWGSAGDATQLAAAAATVGAGTLVSGSHDSALIITLQPGAYTVIVTGVGGTTGVALAEVYEMPVVN